jgi:hypothetical protein
LSTREIESEWGGNVLTDVLPHYRGATLWRYTLQTRRNRGSHPQGYCQRVRGAVHTFLDEGVQVWKWHRPRLCYLIDAHEFPPHLITQLGKLPRILEQEIHRIRKSRGSRIRGSGTASMRSRGLGSTVGSAHSIEVLRNQRSFR